MFWLLTLLLFPDPAYGQTTDCWKVGTTTRCQTEQGAPNSGPYTAPYFVPGLGNPGGPPPVPLPAPRVTTDCWRVGSTLRCQSEPR